MVILLCAHCHVCKEDVYQIQINSGRRQHRYYLINSVDTPKSYTILFRRTFIYNIYNICCAQPKHVKRPELRCSGCTIILSSIIVI